MKKLPLLLLLLILVVLPFFGVFPSSAQNNSPIFENIYLRVAPSASDGVIDLYYKNKVGNWKRFNTLTPLIKVGDSFESAQESKISFTAQQLTDGLSSKPDLTRVKFQFAPFKNGAHVYLLMDMELGKPYVKFSVFKNTGSSDIKEFSLAMTGGLEEFVQKIQVGGTSYIAPNCGTYSPGCSDIRTISDKQEFTLSKPDNKIVTLVGETGVKQLMFLDQDYLAGDKLVTSVKTSGAAKTKSVATPSASRKEEAWFDQIYYLRSPFSGDVNSWYFGIDSESTKQEVVSSPKEKRNLSFRLKFAGVERNAGVKQVTALVTEKKTKVLEKKLNLVGTSSGVYVGTLENLPGKVPLQVYIKGSNRLTTKFDLPVGVETVDWSLAPLLGGDANNDDRVDSTDFGLLQKDYLKNTASSADFNYDNRVDSQDFAILQAGYLVKASKP